MDSKDKCKECNGQKVKENTKNLEVTIEPGVPTDHDSVFYGEGDEYPEISAGDVHIRMKIQSHKQFTRQGADLFMEKKISLLEALSGVQLDIPHFEGKKITVVNLPGDVLSHESVKCIKGKGMPFFHDQMSHGNLYIKFLV